MARFGFLFGSKGLSDGGKLKWARCVYTHSITHLHVVACRCVPRPPQSCSIVCFLICINASSLPARGVSTTFYNNSINPSVGKCRRSTVFDVVQKLQSTSPNAPNVTLTDISTYQYVSCPTRRDKTLRPKACYGSVKNKSLPQPTSA